MTAAFNPNSIEGLKKVAECPQKEGYIKRKSFEGCVPCLPMWEAVQIHITATTSGRTEPARQAFVSARLAVALTLVRLRARFT